MLVAEVSPLVGMAPSTLAEHCRRGRFPHRKLPGSRRLLFPAADVQAYLDGCELETRLLGDGGRIVKPVKRRST
jgi:predicted DNA-binding transcriptional regulator AlpA